MQFCRESVELLFLEDVISVFLQIDNVSGLDCCVEFDRAMKRVSHRMVRRVLVSSGFLLL